MLRARPVDGTFRRLRWAADAILIAILFAIPWIRIGGEPLVLLDVPARRFHVFGLVIFPQELFFLWLILAGLALSLFFFTALAGRLWCGWACPQTVFTDVFAGIARRIQGWHGHRPPRRIPPWRVVLTHLVWVALCAITAFHLVGYFVSPYAMLAGLRAGTISPTVLGFWAVVSALAYLDFAVVRQTFCQYLCPYARFQGVLFDRDTLVIGYDAKRGEPRGKAGRTTGDCVDCGLCVQVCPTGIDIRNGMQLECIACTQCIDACNGVMARLGRERNLIGYRSWVSLEGLRPARILRPRTAVYGTLLVVVAIAFAVLLERRMPLDLYVSHNSQQLTQATGDGRIGNGFVLHITNRDRQDRLYRIALDAPEHYELVAGLNPIPVPATSATETRVFVLSDAEAAEHEDGSIRFVLEEVGNEAHRVERAARFLSGPGGRRDG